MNRIELLEPEDAIVFVSTPDTRFQRTILHYAAAYGQTDLIKLIVSHDDVDLDIRDKFGETPLHRAVRFRHDDVIALLIQSGATVDAVDQKGQTALHRACDMGKATNVQLLLERGANPTLTDESGKTPLMVGVASQYSAGHIDDWMPLMDSALESWKERQSQQIVRNHEATSATLIRCKDGHLVETECERIIDDWLYDHGKTHAIYPTFTTDSTQGPSFYVQSHDMYIQMESKLCPNETLASNVQVIKPSDMTKLDKVFLCCMMVETIADESSCSSSVKRARLTEEATQEKNGVSQWFTQDEDSQTAKMLIAESPSLR